MIRDRADGQSPPVWAPAAACVRLRRSRAAERTSEPQWRTLRTPRRAAATREARGYRATRSYWVPGWSRGAVSGGRGPAADSRRVGAGHAAVSSRVALSLPVHYLPSSSGARATVKLDALHDPAARDSAGTVSGDARTTVRSACSTRSQFWADLILPPGPASSSCCRDGPTIGKRVEPDKGATSSNDGDGQRSSSEPRSSLRPRRAGR
jgi:hypothetical protein